MFSLLLPAHPAEPIEKYGLNLDSDDLADIAFSDWSESDFVQLHALLFATSKAEYRQWEDRNRNEIFSFCQAQKPRRNKTEKWQTSQARLLLPYAHWRLLVVAENLQALFSGLEIARVRTIGRATVHLVDELRSLHNCLESAPWWSHSFGLSTPFPDIFLMTQLGWSIDQIELFSSRIPLVLSDIKNPNNALKKDV